MQTITDSLRSLQVNIAQYSRQTYFVKNTILYLYGVPADGVLSLAPVCRLRM